MTNKRVYWEGMVYDNKVIKEVFRNCAKSEYLLTFTDGSWKVIYTSESANRKRPNYNNSNLNLK